MKRVRYLKKINFFKKDAHQIEKPVSDDVQQMVIDKQIDKNRNTAGPRK